MWGSFKRRILNGIEALRSPVQLQEFTANVKVATEDLQGSRPLTIESTAAKTIERWYRERIGKTKVQQPFRSRPYSELKRRIGLPSGYWNLIFTGRLAKSMKYFVRDGALHVSYSDIRKSVVERLRNVSGLNDLLHPSPEEAAEMAKGSKQEIVQNFLRAWQRRE